MYPHMALLTILSILLNPPLVSISNNRDLYGMILMITDQTVRL